MTAKVQHQQPDEWRAVNRSASAIPSGNSVQSAPTWVETLKVLALLPGTAHLTFKEAAMYIGTTPEVLRVWRSTGKGPRFKGRGHFVRYAKSDLDEFMSGYDHRFETAE